MHLKMRSISAKKVTLTALFFAISIAVIIAKAGVWLMPNLWLQFAISHSVYANPFQDPMAHYLYQSYLEPYLFYLSGLSSYREYMLYCASISIIFLFSYMTWFITHHGYDVSVREGKLLTTITFPSFFICFYWIGMDGLTLLLILLTLIFTKRNAVAIVAALIGTQHFEQGLLSFLILLSTQILSYLSIKNTIEKKDISRTIYIISAICVGKLLLVLWFHFHGIHLQGGRVYYMQKAIPSFVSTWKQYWYYLAWSIFGTAWIIIPALKNSKLPVLSAAALIFFLMLIFGDQTRVASIIVFPTVFYWILSQKKLMKELSVKLSRIATLGFILVPVTVVWGVPHHGLIRCDIQATKNLYEGKYIPETINLDAPFHDSTMCRGRE